MDSSSINEKTFTKIHALSIRLSEGLDYPQELIDAVEEFKTRIQSVFYFVRELSNQVKESNIGLQEAFPDDSEQSMESILGGGLVGYLSENIQYLKEIWEIKREKYERLERLVKQKGFLNGLESAKRNADQKIEIINQYFSQEYKDTEINVDSFYGFSDCLRQAAPRKAVEEYIDNLNKSIESFDSYLATLEKISEDLTKQKYEFEKMLLEIPFKYKKLLNEYLLGKYELDSFLEKLNTLDKEEYGVESMFLGIFLIFSTLSLYESNKNNIANLPNELNVNISELLTFFFLFSPFIITYIAKMLRSKKSKQKKKEDEKRREGKGSSQTRRDNYSILRRAWSNKGKISLGIALVISIAVKTVLENDVTSSLPEGDQLRGLLYGQMHGVRLNVEKKGDSIEFKDAIASNYLHFDEIPDNLIKILMFSEDREFLDHNGISWRGIGRAAWCRVKGGNNCGGGSTITQQLGKKAILNSEHSYLRKILDAQFGVKIDENLSKQEIIMFYLNTVHFGRGINGIENAAQYYFGRSTKNLSELEMAMLVKAIPSPSSKNPETAPKDAEARGRYLIKQMIEEKVFQSDEIDMSVNIASENEYQGLDRRGRTLFDMMIGKIYKHLKGKPDGIYGVVTTINSKLQEYAEQTMNNRLAQAEEGENRERKLRKGEEKSIDLPEAQIEGGTVGIDPVGKVTHMVSSTPYDLVNVAKRQPASTMKTILLYAAIREGYDLNTKISAERLEGGYSPRNWDGKYPEEITLYEAYIYSTNTAFVRVLTDLVGYNKFKDIVSELGLDTSCINDGDTSDALGTCEQTLIDMTFAHSVLPVAQPNHTQPYTIEYITVGDGSIIYPDREAPLVFSITDQIATSMKDAMIGVVSNGTGWRAEIKGEDILGKTGSGQGGDALFIGGSSGNRTSMGIRFSTEDGTFLDVSGGGWPAIVFKDLYSKRLEIYAKRYKSIDTTIKPIETNDDISWWEEVDWSIDSDWTVDNPVADWVNNFRFPDPSGWIPPKGGNEVRDVDKSKENKSKHKIVLNYDKTNYPLLDTSLYDSTVSIYKVLKRFNSGVVHGITNHLIDTGYLNGPYLSSGYGLSFYNFSDNNLTVDIYFKGNEADRIKIPFSSLNYWEGEVDTSKDLLLDLTIEEGSNFIDTLSVHYDREIALLFYNRLGEKYIRDIDLNETFEGEKIKVYDSPNTSNMIVKFIRGGKEYEIIIDKINYYGSLSAKNID